MAVGRMEEGGGCALSSTSTTNNCINSSFLFDEKEMPRRTSSRFSASLSIGLESRLVEEKGENVILRRLVWWARWTKECNRVKESITISI